MLRSGFVAGLLPGAAGAAFPAGTSPAGAGRLLTFERRVEAQAAIERVYHAHRTGEKRPFGRAVAREILERRVRAYLAESVALDALWDSRITARALRRELERIAAATRAPDRLEEIYDTLGRDTFLIQETFVRAVNGCPAPMGAGPLGAGSDGTPRAGRVCP